MEQSLQHAQKLVRNTNTALAQMKHDFLPDDLSTIAEIKPVKQKNKVLSLEDDLQDFETGLRLETGEMMSRMDEMLDTKKYLSTRKQLSQVKALAKIQEINKKIEKRRQELQTKKAYEANPTRERPSSRGQIEVIKTAKVEETPKRMIDTRAIDTSNSLATRASAKPDISPHSDTFVTVYSGKKEGKVHTITEDLKTKLKKTEQIVDRGFQTARQLNERVDLLRKNDRKTDKVVAASEKYSTSDLSNSKSLDRISQRSISCESVRTYDLKKCHKSEISRSKKKKSKECYKENVSLIKIKRPDSKVRVKGKKLRLQHLPSMHIRDGLQLQKILSIDIPPAEATMDMRPNVAVKNYSHEDIEKHRFERHFGEGQPQKRIICYDAYQEDNKFRAFQFRDLCSIPKNKIDPVEIDNLLLQCNFNVFDPRIDEFVERKSNNLDWKDTKESNNEKKKKETTQIVDTLYEIDRTNSKNLTKKGSGCSYQAKKKQPTPKEYRAKHKKSCEKQKVVNEKPKKLQEKSDELSRTFRESAMKLEKDRVKLEHVLKKIFQRVDESRALFEKDTSSSPVEEISNGRKRPRKLSATKPVLLSLLDPKAPKQSADLHKAKKSHEASPKTNLAKINNVKKVEDNHSKSEKTVKKMVMENKTGVNLEQKNARNLKNNVFSLISEKELGPLKNDIMKEHNSLQVVHRAAEPLVSASSEMVNNSGDENRTTKGDDYESDFEVESLEMDSPGKSEKKDISGIVWQLVQKEKNLSTISEVDSDIEKKISDSTLPGKVYTKPPIQLEPEKKIKKNDKKATKKTRINFKEPPNEPKPYVGEAKKDKKVNEKVATFSKEPEKVGATLNRRVKSPELDTSSSVSSINLGVKELTGRMKQDLSEILSESSKELNTARNRFEKILKKVHNKNGSPPTSPKSTRSPKTYPIRNNEINLIKSHSDVAIVKKESSEVVASLKEILESLKNQFAKTEFLADQLTENIKEYRLAQQEVPDKKCKEARKNNNANFTHLQVVNSPHIFDGDVVDNLNKSRIRLRETETRILYSPRCTIVDEVKLGNASSSEIFGSKRQIPVIDFSRLDDRRIEFKLDSKILPASPVDKKEKCTKDRGKNVPRIDASLKDSSRHKKKAVAVENNKKMVSCLKSKESPKTITLLHKSSFSNYDKSFSDGELSASEEISENYKNGEKHVRYITNKKSSVLSVSSKGLSDGEMAEVDSSSEFGSMNGANMDRKRKKQGSVYEDSSTSESLARRSHVKSSRFSERDYNNVPNKESCSEGEIQNYDLYHSQFPANQSIGEVVSDPVSTFSTSEEVS